MKKERETATVVVEIIPEECLTTIQIKCGQNGGCLCVLILLLFHRLGGGRKQLELR